MSLDGTVLPIILSGILGGGLVRTSPWAASGCGTDAGLDLGSWAYDGVAVPCARPVPALCVCAGVGPCGGGP